jgi:cell wall assembly regulator SMI1
MLSSIGDYASTVEPDDSPPDRRAAPDVAGEQALADAWERVERWLEAHHPAGSGALRPGAGEATLERLERVLEQRLPDALRRSLQRHDGQPREVRQLADGQWLLDCEQIAEEWSTRRDVGEAEGWDDWYWRRAWISFASDGAGDSMCVDAESGRVILFQSETPERDIQAPTLEGWLTRWADELEAGEQAFDTDGAIVEAWLVDPRRP